MVMILMMMIMIMMKMMSAHVTSAIVTILPIHSSAPVATKAFIHHILFPIAGCATLPTSRRDMSLRTNAVAVHAMSAHVTSAIATILPIQPVLP